MECISTHPDTFYDAIERIFKEYPNNTLIENLYVLQGNLCDTLVKEKCNNLIELFEKLNTEHIFIYSTCTNEIMYRNDMINFIYNCLHFDIINQLPMSNEYGQCVGLLSNIALAKIPDEQYDTFKWLWKNKILKHKVTGVYYVLIKEKDFDKALIKEN